MHELVSILIPAFNAEKWIGETIRSALNQTWPRTEIIIVDDGSSDSTAEIARSFTSRSIKLVTQQNAGPCVARNTAYALAQGDFIQWLDADDLLATDKIERQMERMDRDRDGNTLLTAACGTFYKNPKRARFGRTPAWRNLSPRELLIRKFCDCEHINQHIVVHSWLVSRTIADMAGLWDVRLQQTDDDGEYACRLVAASDGVLLVPEARCYYRKGLAGSLSATRTNLEREELCLRLLFSHLLSLEDSNETREACLTWLQLWAREFYRKDPAIVNVVTAMSRYLDLPASRVPTSKKFFIAEKMLGPGVARSLHSKVARARTFIEKCGESLCLFC